MSIYCASSQTYVHTYSNNTLCRLRRNVFCIMFTVRIVRPCKQVRSEHAVASLRWFVYMHSVNIPNRQNTVVVTIRLQGR
jgi:hypothetical protein